MKGKIKKAIGIALLVCIALTGLGLAATPASAADNDEFVFFWDYDIIFDVGYDDHGSQTCYELRGLDKFEYDNPVNPGCT